MKSRIHRHSCDSSWSSLSGGRSSGSFVFINGSYYITPASLYHARRPHESRISERPTRGQPPSARLGFLATAPSISRISPAHRVTSVTARRPHNRVLWVLQAKRIRVPKGWPSSHLDRVRSSACSTKRSAPPLVMATFTQRLWIQQIPRRCLPARTRVVHCGMPESCGNSSWSAVLGAQKLLGRNHSCFRLVCPEHPES